MTTTLDTMDRRLHTLADMSMYQSVPPQKQEQFERFMAAHANTGTVLDAVRTWIDEMPVREDLAGNEIVAPPYTWLSERTRLTDGMLATALLALFASGGIRPHPHREDVWLLSGEGDIELGPARERLLTVLDIITSSGHHMTGHEGPGQPRTADDSAPGATPVRRSWRHRLGAWKKRRTGCG